MFVSDNEYRAKQDKKIQLIDVCACDSEPDTESPNRKAKASKQFNVCADVK